MDTDAHEWPEISDREADYEGVPERLRAVKGLLVAGLTSKVSGVYFLCRGNECVYVGQAINIAGRAGRHVDKEYDRVFYIPVHPNNLSAVEKSLIQSLIPKYNNCSTVNRMRRACEALAKLRREREARRDAILDSLAESPACENITSN